MPACLLATGIVLDRMGVGSLHGWLLLGFAAATVSWILSHWTFRRSSSLVLAVALLSLGGVRHRLFWWSRQADNILKYAAEESVPIRLEGVVISSVTLRKAVHHPRLSPWMQIDHSLTALSCLQVWDGARAIPVSGVVRLDVEGHLLNTKPGDRVEVVGHLSRAGRPRNPGDLEFQTWLRSQGIDAILRCEHPVALRHLGTESGGLWWLHRRRASLRGECEQVLQRNLSQAALPVGLSIMLGDRSGMTEELRDQFTQSGTMHLLAISGLHVAMLLGMVLAICRGLNMQRASTACVLLLTAVGYAVITDQQPSVIRATMLAAIFVLAYIRIAATNAMNSLCLCAALLILWQPGALFDIGAQLSFLAVAVIIQVNRHQLSRQLADAFRHDVPSEIPASLKALRSLGRSIRDLWVLTGAIWLVTAPLTTWSFHLLSPIGVLVNVLLIPFSGVVLALGFLTLGAGLLLPGTTPWIAPLFDGSLIWLTQAAGWSSHLWLGHVYLPGLPTWWIIGFYVGLAIAWRVIAIPISNRGLWTGLGLWTLGGLSWGLLPAEANGLRCTFLAVGHGSTAVLELPDGKVLVFDNGTFGDGNRAARILENFLWSRGISGIDAMILSHADTDHFNGVSTICDRVPIGTLILASTFLDFRQEAVFDVCRAAAAKGIPIRITQAGDRIQADPAVQIDVLHPNGAFRSKLDNANSIVLCVEFAGRKLLLTGDVEAEGLVALQATAQGPFDLLLSPHHGAKSANPRGLFTWAQPGHVIISGGTLGVLERIKLLNRPETPVYNTFDHGAIEVTIRDTGDLRVGAVSP